MLLPDRAPHTQQELPQNEARGDGLDHLQAIDHGGSSTNHTVTLGTCINLLHQLFSFTT
jgi:hypothetical protein